MEYTTLGDTGMEVSRLCLGCMSFGLDSSGKYDWSIGAAESREIIERAIDLGVTFFDTSNSYSWGDSERILGDVLEDYDRDRQVVATKVRFASTGSEYPNATGLSRKTIEQELSKSLDRLGMDTVDLYQIHRWDPDTPIETTLRSLDDAVRDGKVRYTGASSMWAHQFAEALHTSDSLGLERFQTMQNHYNLVYREEEREMLPLCEAEGLGVIPWSPMARGYLTRPHEEYMSTKRAETDDYAQAHPYADNGGREVNERVQELAADKGVSMAQLALSWLLHNEWVDAPIIGASKIQHLEDAVEALAVSLSASDVAYLEEPYEPVPVSGHE